MTTIEVLKRLGVSTREGKAEPAVAPPEPEPTRPRISPYVPEGGIDPELLPEILEFAMRKQAELLERRRKEAEEGKG